MKRIDAYNRAREKERKPIPAGKLNSLLKGEIKKVGKMFEYEFDGKLLRNASRQALLRDVANLLGYEVK